ncbi:lasso peptide biosynthesis B2 protein [Neobacillus sp. 179-J 1A1 HS]|uniref:lasso peptide biosynthesis B2 protein n=1 Tax=Neobacillus driksii TaxID=3035913 RepID=UPI0035BC33FE
MNKIKVFFSLNKSIKFLLVEAYFILAWARFIKSLPFSKVAQHLGESMSETSFSNNEENIKLIREVSFAINVMSRYTFWESMCLVKAIAGMKMLEKRKVESTLYLGTGKDEDGNMIAHAWLRSGPFFLTGAEEMNRFTVIGKFSKKNSLDSEGN